MNLMVDSTHLICDFKYRGDMGNIYEKITRSIKKGNLNVVKECIHNFNPHGISLIFILAESHISIHTWEEEHIINVDLFVCGDSNPKTVLVDFLKQFDVVNKSEQSIIRNGIL